MRSFCGYHYLNQNFLVFDFTLSLIMKTKIFIFGKQQKYMGYKFRPVLGAKGYFFIMQLRDKDRTASIETTRYRYSLKRVIEDAHDAIDTDILWNSPEDKAE